MLVETTRWRCTLAVIVAFLMAIATTSATDYYVATNGLDTAPCGNSHTPCNDVWLLLQQLVMTPSSLSTSSSLCAMVHVASGTYARNWTTAAPLDITGLNISITIDKHSMMNDAAPVVIDMQPLADTGAAGWQFIGAHTHLTIDGITFTNNYGGASTLSLTAPSELSTLVATSSITITNCRWTNHSNHGKMLASTAAALHIVHPSIIITITHCSLYDHSLSYNFVQPWAGLIVLASVHPDSITPRVAMMNTSTSVTINDVIITNSDSVGAPYVYIQATPGGTHINNISVTHTNTTTSRSDSLVMLGGVHIVGAGDHDHHVAIDIINCYMAYNQRSGSSTLSIVTSNITSINVTNSSFISNTMQIVGAVVSDKDASRTGVGLTILTDSNTPFADTAASIIIDGCIFDGNMVIGEAITLVGGAMSIHSGAVTTIHRSSFTHNTIHSVTRLFAIWPQHLFGGGAAIMCYRLVYKTKSTLLYAPCSVHVTASYFAHNVLQSETIYPDSSSPPPPPPTTTTTGDVDMGEMAGSGLYIESATRFPSLVLSATHWYHNMINSVSTSLFHWIGGAGIAVVTDRVEAYDIQSMFPATITITRCSWSRDYIVTHHDQMKTYASGCVLATAQLLPFMSQLSATHRGVANMINITESQWRHCNVSAGATLNGGALFIYVGDMTTISDTSMYGNTGTVQSLPLVIAGGGAYFICAQEYDNDEDDQLPCGVTMMNTSVTSNWIWARSLDEPDWVNNDGVAGGGGLAFQSYWPWRAFIFDTCHIHDNAVEGGSLRWRTDWTRWTRFPSSLLGGGIAIHSNISMVHSGGNGSIWAMDKEIRGTAILIQSSVWSSNRIEVMCYSGMYPPVGATGGALAAMLITNITILSTEWHNNRIITIASSMTSSRGGSVAITTVGLPPVEPLDKHPLTPLITLVDRCIFTGSTIEIHNGVRYAGDNGMGTIGEGFDILYAVSNVYQRTLSVSNTWISDSYGEVAATGSRLLGSISVLFSNAVSEGHSTSTVTFTNVTMNHIRSLNHFGGKDCVCTGYCEYMAQGHAFSRASTIWINSVISDVYNDGGLAECASALELERLCVLTDDTFDGLHVNRSDEVTVNWWNTRGSVYVAIANSSWVAPRHRGVALLARPLMGDGEDHHLPDVFVSISDTRFTDGYPTDTQLYLYNLRTINITRCVWHDNVADIGAPWIVATNEQLDHDTTFALSHSVLKDNEGEGHCGVFRNTEVVNIDNTNQISCRTDELAVMVDWQWPYGWPNDTIWGCALGAPFKWTIHHARAACTPCPAQTVDNDLLAAISSTSLFDPYGASVAIIESLDYIPECRACHGRVDCDGKLAIKAPRGWQLMVKPTGVRGQFDAVAAIVPPGTGCNDEECTWNTSCARGRDVSVPFCGACLVNQTEALGTGECLHISQCGGALSILAVISAACLSLLYVLYQSSGVQSASGGIVEAGLFFAQTVDMVTSQPSVLTRFAAVFDLQLGATSSATGICFHSMTAVDKILSGYYLPLSMVAAWIVLAILRYLTRCHTTAMSRIISFSHSPSMMINGSDQHRHPLLHDESFIVDDADEARHINTIMVQPSERCCRGRLPIPSVELALLSMAFISYSGVLKSTMSLLQCRPSPIDDTKLVMFLAGNTECYTQWYQIMAFILLVGCVLFPFALLYVATRTRGRSTAIVRHSIMVTYRTKYIGGRGQCIQLLRRFILVLISTFTQVPETRSLLLVTMFLLYLILHLNVLPFASAHANFVETVSLVALVLLGAMDVATSAHITGGSDLRNNTQLALSVVIMALVFIVGVAAFVHNRCAHRCNNDNNNNIATQGGDHHDDDTKRVMAASTINGSGSIVASGSRAVIRSQSVRLQPAMVPASAAAELVSSSHGSINNNNASSPSSSSRRASQHVHVAIDR